MKYKEFRNAQQREKKLTEKRQYLAESLVFESGSLQTSATVRQLVLEGVHLKKNGRGKRK